MERGCLTSHCLRVAPLGKSRFLLNVVMAELVRYLDVGRRRGETESLFFFFGGGGRPHWSALILALGKVHRALVSYY